MTIQTVDMLSNNESEFSCQIVSFHNCKMSHVTEEQRKVLSNEVKRQIGSFCTVSVSLFFVNVIEKI